MAIRDRRWPPVLLDQSISGIENLEHLYQQYLPSGTYRLRLSLASAGDVPASVAWRLSTVPHHPEIVVENAESTIKLSFAGLVNGQACLIQGSPDLVNWSAEQAFTATGPLYSWTAPSMQQRGFYRLAATD